MASNDHIEINAEFKKALEVMEHTSKNVFITGKAGTGKSTLLNYFRSHTDKKVVVLAPTGVAALNVQGETMHSFFRFKPDITLQKIKKLSGKRGRIFNEIDAIIIDEISMVRADLLDCADKFLRLNTAGCKRPFGGIQMIFIGDLYQLPPVVTSSEKDIFRSHYQSQYFFDAAVFKEFPMEFIELEKIYRQKDEKFIGLLNAIRNNSITDEDLALLNRRVGAEAAAGGNSGYTVHLGTTNKTAAEINAEHLNRLKTRIHTYSAKIEGDFKEYSYPTDSALRLAVGAQVMLLNNDTAGRWVNGSLGEITKIKSNREENADSILIKLAEGNIEEVFPFSWEIFHFSFNETSSMIEAETVGSFTQYPLKLAWAITIHKSQGKTYVALSRCRSFEGISLVRPLRKSDILMDRRVVRFVTNHQYGLSERDMPFVDKLSMIKEAITHKLCLEITYLKASDEKSRRVLKPRRVGTMSYLDKEFMGLEAFCLQRKEDRVFRVDRILEMKTMQLP